jgi:exosortase K
MFQVNATRMNQQTNWKRYAQLLVVLFAALTLKLYYSTAGPDQLRWILAPTTVLVELISGRQFEFESHAGYLSDDRRFLIAGSCAGVNFLITAFLMLSLGKLWRYRSQNMSWRFIPAAACFAFVATLIANTVRISTALWLQQSPVEFSGLSRNQLHRFEGIFIYFGFLLLLYMLSEKLSTKRSPGLLRQFFFPLLIYYTTTLGIPLANGAGGPAATDFWHHSVFVLLIPLLLILPLVTFRFYLERRLSQSNRPSLHNSSSEICRIA